MGNVIAVQSKPILQQIQEVAEKIHSKISACAQAALNILKEALSATWSGFQHTIEFLAHSFKENENIQTVCKLGKSAIGFATKVLKVESEGLKNLGTVFAGGDTLIDVFGVFGSIKYWASGEFKKDIEGSPYKVTSKGFSTVSRVIGVGLFIVDVFKLGHIADALNTIPFFKVALEFSPVKVVKDALGLIGAAFSIVDSSIKLHKKRTGNEKEIIELKRAKWEIREAIAKYEAANPEEKALGLANAGQIDEQDFYNNMQQMFEQKCIRLNELGVSRKYSLAPTERQLERSFVSVKTGELSSLEKCKGKLLKKELEIKDHAVAQHKEWIAIALNIVKVAAITLGLVATFALALSGPVLAGVIGAAWLITSVVGIVRLYHGWRQDEKQKNEHKKADTILEKAEAIRVANLVTLNVNANNNPPPAGGPGPNAPVGNGDQDAPNTEQPVAQANAQPRILPNEGEDQGRPVEDENAFDDDDVGAGEDQAEEAPAPQDGAAE